MKELLTRLTSTSPAFFKRIQALGITLGAVGLALLAIPASVIVLPAGIITVAGYFVAAGSVAAAVSKLTVADSNVLKEQDLNRPITGPQVQSTVDTNIK